MSFLCMYYVISVLADTFPMTFSHGSAYAFAVHILMDVSMYLNAYANRYGSPTANPQEMVKHMH